MSFEGVGVWSKANVLEPDKTELPALTAPLLPSYDMADLFKFSEPQFPL